MTHDDLKNINLNSRLPVDEQSLLLAIQTPHGSQLSVFKTKEVPHDIEDRAEVGHYAQQQRNPSFN